MKTGGVVERGPKRTGSPGPPEGHRTMSSAKPFPPAAETPTNTVVAPKGVPLWTNAITVTGLLLTPIALLLLVAFWLFAAVTETNPYFDIVGYLVLPTLLVVGGSLVPAGILIRSWRLHRRDPSQRLHFWLPQLDLNDRSQRRVAAGIIVAVLTFLPLLGVSGYHGYHYSDSADFCSKACHAVMQPQAVTYEHSAHARVPCAECHIGEGASWFVRAKLSGTRQVFATMFETFSRPIPPAIHHLRPARETCERCHWPKKFFGSQLREIVHFASDEANTRHEINVLLKTGGGDESSGKAEGIHLHMALAAQIDYVSTDDRLQVIPWVRMRDAQGRETAYRSDGRPAADPPPSGQLRKLDCMDCHNRPAHRFRSPQEAVNIDLETGRIDPTLPYVKREAVAAMVAPYADLPAAIAGIAAHVTEFYAKNYPELSRERGASIAQAVERLRESYQRSFFPYMRVDWKTYPDNIGHMTSPGCFRCHDGKHVDERGEAIRSECNICHTFLNPVEAEKGTYVQHGEYLHPYVLEGVHSQLRCDQCHTGGITPPPSCTGCHSSVTAYREGKTAAFQSFGIRPDPMASAVDCDGCHDLAQPRNLTAMNERCLECHEDDGEEYKAMLGSWKSEIERLLQETGSLTRPEDHALVAELRKAGPLHNTEASRTILRKLLDGAKAPAARNDRRAP